MRLDNISCKTKKKFKATTDSRNNKLINSNLLNSNFDVVIPNKYLFGYIS